VKFSIISSGNDMAIRLHSGFINNRRYYASSRVSTG
jgi:hypothetical protein